MNFDLLARVVEAEDLVSNINREIQAPIRDYVPVSQQGGLVDDIARAANRIQDELDAIYRAVDEVLAYAKAKAREQAA